MKDISVEGNYEVKYIGMRIEIDKNRILFLWRNSPVLNTVFKLKEEDDRLYFILKNQDLAYVNSPTSYAKVSELYMKDGVLYLTEDFPFSGVSKDELYKTENSRFGAYDEADEILDELQGKWEEIDGNNTFVIKNNVLSFYGIEEKIKVLKNKKEKTPSYLIVDEDPSVYDLKIGFTRFNYCGGIITTYMIVYDAESKMFMFKKSE